jgi:hypothetical protein
MKKLQLKKMSISEPDLLTREQLKKMSGGSGYTCNNSYTCPSGVTISCGGDSTCTTTYCKTAQGIQGGVQSISCDGHASNCFAAADCQYGTVTV